MRAAVAGMVILGVIVPAMSAVCSGDDVATYLEQHGLREVLALHLEEQLERAQGEDKAAIAMQLAELYAELLEATSDVALRIDLETRSRELMKIAPQESTDALQFALLRGSYTAAERIAESRRLYLAEDAEVAQALEIFDDLIPRLTQLASSIDQKLDIAERRLGRARGEAAGRLLDERQQLRQLSTRTRFLAGWSCYYRAWLRKDPILARQAEVFFGSVLDREEPVQSISDVSRDILGGEASARTVLGMALSRSIINGADESLRWLDLLTADDVFHGVREQVPAWQMAVRLDHRQYARVMRELTVLDELDENATLPAAWFRLAAAAGLANADTDPNARSLAVYAIAQLAAQGKLEEVLDLAQRFGTSAMGEGGFAIRYVAGARLYQEARTLHGDDEPTSNADVIELYESAAANLAAAVTESDADAFPAAAAGARLLRAWCFYFQGKLLDARTAFAEASLALAGDEAPEALWMAIVSLDRLTRAQPTPSLETDLIELSREFLTRYPASPRAPQLILRVASETPSLEQVEKLLSIAPNSGTYDAARQRAAGMLYELFRTSTGDDRIGLGQRYLTIAVPLFAAVDDDMIAIDADARTIFVVRGRRILDVALATGIDRGQLATETLDRFEQLRVAGVIATDEYAAELHYRGFQVAALNGDWTTAANAADALWENASDSEWAATATRRMLFESVRNPAEPGKERLRLERIVHFGGRTIISLEALGASAADQQMLATYIAVADAARALYDQYQEKPQGERALYIYRERLLAGYPDNIDFLSAVGLLGPDFDDAQSAINAWRKLVNGQPVESEGWFEAKYRLIALLNATEPAHAREVFDQFRALYPDLGPAPWSEKFTELERTLQKKGEQ